MPYPLEIEIDEPRTEVMEEMLTELEHAILDIRDRWERTEDRLVHTADLNELLAAHNAIAVVWDIRHVQDQRPDLSDEQAWEILQACEPCVDRLNDPMRVTIRQVADRLYPPRREVRLSKVADIIASYGNGDERENLVDLLTDAMHWCSTFGEPFDAFCSTARLHFGQETQPATKGIEP